jgi:hypothetical protein
MICRRPRDRLAACLPLATTGYYRSWIVNYRLGNILAAGLRSWRSWTSVSPPADGSRFLLQTPGPLEGSPMPSQRASQLLDFHRTD